MNTIKLNDMMQAVGIATFVVDEDGVHPTNEVAQKQMYSQEIERYLSAKSDNVAVIYEQAGEVQPYRVELNENGQGYYFEELAEAQQFAKDHTESEA